MTRNNKYLCASITVLAMMMAHSAFAGDNNGPQSGGDSSALAAQGQGQLQGQAQGQGQGQAQAAIAAQGQTQGNVGINGQQQGIDRSGNSTVTASGNSNNRNDLTNIGVQGQTTDASSRNANINGALNEGNNSAQEASNTTSVDASDHSSYTEAVQRRAPVSTAYAAPTMIGGGVCAYSPLSFGGQAVAAGGSIAFTKIDKGCDSRAMADIFSRMGQQEFACELLLSNKSARKVADRTGFSCSGITARANFDAVIASPDTPLIAQPLEQAPKQPRG